MAGLPCSVEHSREPQNDVGTLNIGWQTDWVKRLHGFREAERVLEIGAGSFAALSALGKAFPEKWFSGLDFTISKAAIPIICSATSNVTIIRHDARRLDLLASDYFDFVFSIAVMEHIKEMEEHLTEVFRIIRPGGRYWFWQAPFWSCSMGHHYRHSEPSCPVPHYAHLFMTPARVAKHLRSRGLEPNCVRQILQRIYERDDLSRISRTQAIAICRNSPFIVQEWLDDPDQHHTVEKESTVMANNLYNIRREDLRIKGAKVCLFKPVATSTM